MHFPRITIPHVPHFPHWTTITKRLYIKFWEFQSDWKPQWLRRPLPTSHVLQNFAFWSTWVVNQNTLTGVSGTDRLCRTVEMNRSLFLYHQTYEKFESRPTKNLARMARVNLHAFADSMMTLCKTHWGMTLTCTIFPWEIRTAGAYAR